MNYYLPIPLIIVFAFMFSKNSARNSLKILKFINISVLLTLTYSIILGLYFKNYSLEIFDNEYPSKIISKWTSILLYFAVIPLDLFYFIRYKITQNKK